MPLIKHVFAREILDSRGYPTIETEVFLDSGTHGKSAIPSGASTGSFEAVELRDGGTRFLGKGVLGAVKNVNELIFPALIGKNAVDQAAVDGIMIGLDGTTNKGILGANAILSVSLAVCKAAANYYRLPLYRYIGGLAKYKLPRPMMNILNGGVHADNRIDIQEFMIVPVKESSFMDYVIMCSTVYHNLKKHLKSVGLNSNVGDEGGVAPNLSSTKEALDCVMNSIEISGYKPGEEVQIAIDVAASELHEDGKYQIDGECKTSSQLIEFYGKLMDDYPIISFEDPFAEEDWSTFAEMTTKFGKRVQIVGDDLYVTNSKRLQKGIDMAASNAILIKPNQIGTLTETLATINLAKANGYNIVISHRSGETNDTTIADLSVAVSAEYIKTGAPARGERVAKYNQLIRIEESFGKTQNCTVVPSH
ncbi:MAG: phosphopyruvate hydratase [Holosporales bacterium]|jgi:enolase|nr:phosphopyruvate hydratase [Holosporales bacterium]